MLFRSSHFETSCQKDVKIYLSALQIEDMRTAVVRSMSHFNIKMEKTLLCVRGLAQS